MKFIDTHAHLDFKQYRKDLDDVLDRARGAGMVAAVTIGISVKTSRKALEIAERYSDVFSTVGIHPHEADSASPETIGELREIAKNERVVAVGECGLDYVRSQTTPDEQDRAFRMQMDLTAELGLPVVIHSREAYDEVLKIMDEYKSGVKGVIHCMSGDASFRDAAVELGYSIAVGGPVTYTANDGLREVMAGVPKERLLIETDCPFLIPQSKRPGRNEPALLLEVIDTLAELHDMTPDCLGDLTTKNAIEVFRLPVENAG